MKPFVHLSLLLLGLFAFVQVSTASSALTETQAQTFLHDSGLDTLISSLPQTMEQQLNLKRLTETNQLKFEEAERAITEAAQSIQNTTIALNYLTTKADAKSLNGAMDFLASPLGKRITAEEREASSADAQLEMQAYTMQMAQNPPPEARIKLVQNLADALNADEVIIKLMQGTFYSLLNITEEITPEASAALKSGLDAEWNKMEPMLRQQFGQYMVMGAHYSYRNLSDEDLKSYIDFLNTPSGQAYWSAGIEIVDLYMKQFITELVSIIKAKG